MIPTSRNSLYSSIAGLFAFFFSLFLFPYCTQGDQIAYREFYCDASNSWDIASQYSLYRDTVLAMEPGYFLVVSIVSHFIDKDLFFSIINGIFAWASSLLLLRRGYSPLLLLLLPLNLYVLTLFFSTERLKMGFLFFAIALLTSSDKVRWILIFSSSLFHLQMFVPIACYFIWIALNRESAGWKLWSTMFFFGLVAASILFVFRNTISEYVELKKSFYDEAGWGGIISTIKPCLLILVAAFFCQHKIAFAFSTAPILLSAYVFGSERITILAFWLMLYASAGMRNGFNVPVVCSLSYFVYGGTIFLYKIITLGAGYFED